MRLLTIFLVGFVSSLVLPFVVRVACRPTGDLQGCLQMRYESSAGDRAGFSVRRAKVWKKGQLARAPVWFYKLQVETDSRRAGKLHLQDAYAEFRTARWRLRFGQMVPEFSLERAQSDCFLPVPERAQVVEVLHPGSETDCRDIGVAATADSLLRRGHVAVGVFNGTGANRLAKTARVGMVVSRIFWRLRGGPYGRGHFGVSVMRRWAQKQSFKKIFGDDRPFTGTDTRVGLEFFWQVSSIQFQAELLRGGLGPWHPGGHYVLATWAVGADLRLVGYEETFRGVALRAREAREVGLGCVWSGPGDRVRWLAFSAWRRPGDGWPVFRAQLQILLD